MKKLYIIMLAAMTATTAMGARVSLKAGHRSVSVQQPVTLPATDITPEGFTANWKAVPGTETYSVLVYEPTTITTDGEYVILNENFNLVSEGSTVEPFFPDDALVELSDYDWTYTPDWQGFWPVFARGMVSGIIYSPYIDLVNDGGRFTVTMEVVGTAGARVVLKSSGDTTTETATFDLTQNGTNVFVHTFTNGCHDTFLTFTDYGITDDPNGDYQDKYDFLDEITVTQSLKAGDQALRLVATAETGRTSQSFAELPYRYGATELAYDVQANVVEFGPDYDDDPYDYEVYRSPYSELEYVTLKDTTKPDEPDPINPDDPDPEYPTGNDLEVAIGNFDNPTAKDIENGTWWDRAPYQWYTRYSGSQMIYTADMLKGMRAGDVIKEIVFKYQDQGAFASLMTDLTLVANNTEATEFVQKEDSDKWLWEQYDDENGSRAEFTYQADLWYMQDEEIHCTLNEPLTYNGQSLLLTCWSENTGGNEVSECASIVKYCDTRNTMVFGSDNETFESVFATGYNYPYMTPNKWVPVIKLVFDRENAVETITVDTDNTDAIYYDLQGRRVVNPSAAGIYVRQAGDKVEKVVIK